MFSRMTLRALSHKLVVYLFSMADRKKKKKLCLKIHVHVFMKKVKTGCKMLKTPKNLSITAACLFPSHLSFLKIRSYIITKYNYIQ